MKENLLKKLLFVFVCNIHWLIIHAQNDSLTVADNLVTDGIPALPAAVVAAVKKYTESRSAVITSWHPLKKQMLIVTRFRNTPQIHLVKMAGWARKQLTLFDGP